MNKEQILKNSEQNNVKYVRLMFTDISGIIKNVEIPADELEDALDGKVMFDGSSIEGFVRIQEADMYLKPDFNTWLVLEYENSKYGNVARLICDVFKMDGTPFEEDPRYVLKRNLEKAKQLGYSQFNIGVEPEFFLFQLGEDGLPSVEPADGGGYFDLAPIDLAEDCRRDIVLELERIGFHVQTAHHEVAKGQNEINFRFDGALEAADRLQQFKIVVKNVARRHNLHATFMPKPISDINGSGMHTNCSLMNEQGENAFYSKKDSMQLSDIARFWIAGIMEHARGFTAITNPSVNSYKRLIPGYEAPCYISWSDANRSAMIRIPAVRGNATRTEIRSVDPTTNPYLAFAVILASGLDGIEKQKYPLDPTYANLFEMTREERENLGILNLPENLKDALKAFKKDEVVKNALGEKLVSKFHKSRSREWDKFRTAVTDWELKNYLTRY